SNDPTAPSVTRHPPAASTATDQRPWELQLARFLGERCELVGDESGRGALAAQAPVTHREHRLPAMEPLEAERRADDLLAVAGLRVDVAEARERRAADDRVAEVVGRPHTIQALRRVVLAVGAADEVRARRVDQVLLRAHTGRVDHVVALA